MKETLTVVLRGGLYLGGGVAPGLQGATLRDSKDYPFIPASALKGAIREQLSRLTGSVAAAKILGGKGGDPLLPNSDPENSKMIPEREGGGSTGVFISDAHLVDGARAWFDQHLGYTEKPQVGIDRRSRKARDKHLFHRQIIAPFAEGLHFVAEVETDLLTVEQKKQFRAAVLAVFALGGGRTAGLGAVELRYSEIIDSNGDSEQSKGPNPRASSQETCIPQLLPQRGKSKDREEIRIDLELEAIDPLCLGQRLLGNFLRSHRHIPASTLRGALVTAALRQRGRKEKRPEIYRQNQTGQPWFDEAVLIPETCLRFSDAFPIQDGQLKQPKVAPVTLKTCKYHEYEHGYQDTLLQGFLRHRLTLADKFPPLIEFCPRCGENGRLVAAKKPMHAAPLDLRLMTRLHLDTASGRAEDGKLFTLELIEKGTRFHTKVTGVNDRNRWVLDHAVGATLRVGHGRGQGYGRLRITSATLGKSQPLATRLEKFDNKVASALRILGLGSKESGLHYFAATLLSDLVIDKPKNRPETAFRDALGLDRTSIVYGQVRTGQKGGWDARGRHPKPIRPTIRAGSVLLLSTPHSLRDLSQHFNTLEHRGIGDLREEGCGWLSISDPIHLKDWRST